MEEEVVIAQDYVVEDVENGTMQMIEIKQLMLP